MSKKSIDNRDLKVGQTVYLKPSEHTRINSYDDNIVEGVLKTIGRKYYTVAVGAYSQYQFYKEDLQQKGYHAPDYYYNAPDYYYDSPDYYLYFDMQDIRDDDEKAELTKIARKALRDYGSADLTLDQLRRIKAILDEGANGKNKREELSK